MTPTLFDSSVCVKWVLEEEHSAIADRLRDREISIPGACYCIDLALLEMGNAVWVREHRSMISRAEVEEAFSMFLTIPRKTIATTDRAEEAFKIALDYQIAVYDAAFIEAMIRTGYRGVTADMKLFNRVSQAHPSLHLLKNLP